MAKRPNILLVMVDQYRFPRFSYGADHGFPEALNQVLGFQGEVDGDNPYKAFFPGLWSLRKGAVVLRNHTIAASACTPSRAVIMTGQYGTRTGVTQTDGLFKSGDSPLFPWLAPGGIPTIGSWLREAGYTTHYFGKWHVSNPPEHSLKRYGFDDWELSYPEPHGSQVNNLGMFRDYAFADLAATFLRRKGLALDWDRREAQRGHDHPLAEDPPAEQAPWFAVVSFANPHDIATYPALPRQLAGGGGAPASPAGGLPPVGVPPEGAVSTLPTAGTMRVPLNPQGFTAERVKSAPTQDRPLVNKPSCQLDYAYKMGLGLASKSGFSAAQGLREKTGASKEAAGADAVDFALLAGIPFQLTDDPAGRSRTFLQYYAYLHQAVDKHIERVLHALDEAGLADDTIVVFLSDHGELGAAQFMMMEKWHNAYQETVHVPVVIRDPSLAGDGSMRQIDALTSHADIVPTLLGLAGIEGEERARLRERLAIHHVVPPLVGADLAPLLRGDADQVIEPDGSPRQGVLFITDDEITEPLPAAGDPHSARGRAEFEVFQATVSAVIQGSSRVPHSGPVPALRPGPVCQPNHVRCVRSGDWKLARYFDPSGEAAEEWEMYDLAVDPNETTNLLVVGAPFPTVVDPLPRGLSSATVEAEARRLQQLLGRLEARMLPDVTGAASAPARRRG